MNRKAKNGSALILVMVSGIVLSILVGALYMLFQANVRSQSYIKESIQARYTAEAGLNMAVHMVMEGADVPHGDDPIQFLPEVGDWEFMGDELGWVQVWVDPHKNNDEVSSANAYEVRCLSKVMSEDQTYMYGISSMVLPRNFAVYATFLNSAGSGWFGDGYRFDGPFHSNSVVQLSSQTAGRDNDPWFYSLSIAADHYLYRNPGTGITEVATTPHYGNLYIEPYEKMVLYEPYFNLNVDSIPFGSDEVNWQGAYNAASSGGLVLSSAQVPDGTRMILQRDTLLVLADYDEEVDTFDLRALSNSVVWINNGPNDTVYLKTEEESPVRAHGLPDDFPLTIGVNGNLAVSGPILYHNIDLTDENNKGMLGIVIKEGNFEIAYDPDMQGLTDWIVPGMDDIWDISTDQEDYPRGIEVDAVVMVLDGMFQMQDVLSWPYNIWPNPAIDFEMVGGYIINEEYITTWVGGGSTWGYLTFVTYDPRLMSMHPPYFPQTGIWDTAYWEEVPEMTDDELSPYWIGENQI